MPRDELRQRLREGRKIALAVIGHRALGGGVGDHLPPPRRHAAKPSGQRPRRRWKPVLAAGVDQHHGKPRGAPGRGDRLAQLQRLGLLVARQRQPRVFRHEVVRAADLHAMAGIVEKRGVRAPRAGAKGVDRAVEAGEVDIRLGLDAEAERLQRAPHRLDVVPRVFQRRDMLVVGDADQQRDLLRPRRARAERQRENRRENPENPHRAAPSP